MIEIGNNTLSSVVRLTTSGTEMDMQLAEQLKNKIEEVTEDIDIEIDLLPPSLPSITLPSSSYSFLIHQSISFTIDMNGVMNCHITPSLPQGLILNRTTCTISGTLTSLSFSSYNITAISHSNTIIRIVSIEIISSLISYPQTNLIIGQGLSFSITPNLTKVSTISIVSGSLPIGLSINPSTGVISGSPSQLLSSQSVTIEAMATFWLVFAIKAACGAFDLGTFGVFLTIVSCGTTFGGLTGYAMNAARDTAPRLAFAILPIKGKGDADWAYGLTAPLIGPVIGALVAVAVYAALPL